MKTNNWQWKLLLCICLLLIIVIGVARNAKKLAVGREKAEAERAEEVLRNAQGRPASVDDLKEGAVYFCTSSLLDIDAEMNRTNRYAVLSAVMVGNFEKYLHAEPRLFELPFSLEINRYYEFSKAGTNLRFREYPPPTVSATAR